MKPDHAKDAVAQIKDSGEYVLIQHVPIFDEHDQFDAEGNLVRRVDKAKLEDIADKGQTKEKKHGDLTPIGIGHTRPLPAPETDQPPIIGYACNYQVGMDRRAGRWTLYTDWWIKRKDLDALKEFPRRSIELWKLRGDVDWIAVLKRSPDRPLGLLIPDVGETNVLPRYMTPTGDGPAVYEREWSGDAKVYCCYCTENQMGDPTTPPSAAVTAGPGGDYNQMKQHIDRYMRETYPHLGDMHSRHVASMGGAGGAPATPAFGAAPSAHIPAPQPATSSADPTRHSAEEEARRKDQEVHYAKLNDATMRLAALEKESKDQELRYQTERVNRLVDPLEREGFLFNRERLVHELLPMDEKQRFDRLGEVRQYSRQDPAAAKRFVETAKTGFEGKDAPRLASEHDIPEGKEDQFIQYCRDGKDYEDALKLCRG